MTLLERYIFRTSMLAFLASLGVLTAVIWTTQALREFDLLTTKGQSLVIFFTVTGLTIPSLVMIIAPVALFISILYCLNKLNGDSELIVMSAAGTSPARIMRPFAVVTLIVAILVGFMSLVAMPWSFKSVRDLFTKIRADFLTRVVREGTFTTLDQGFVFHYRERGANGAMLGIFMQDRRDPEHVTSYVAEVGQTIETGDQDYLVLEKGSVQRQQANSVDAAIIRFDRYAIDLAQFGAEGEGAPYKPRERSTMQLLSLDRSDHYVQRFEGRFRAELHDRFINPLYAIAFAAIAFAALGHARTTRQDRGIAIATSVLTVLILRVAGFGASALVVKSASAVILDYALPLIAVAAGLAISFAPSFASVIRRAIMPRALLRTASG